MNCLGRLTERQPRAYVASGLVGVDGLVIWNHGENLSIGT